MDEDFLKYNFTSIILWSIVSFIVTFFGLSWFFQTSKKKKYFPELDRQSIQLKDGSRISRFMENSSDLGEEDFETMFKTFEKGMECKTVHDAFQKGMRIAGEDGKCLGVRNKETQEYNWMTYKEVEDAAKSVGSGLVKIGLDQGNESFIGLYCINCVEWVILDQACSMFSIINVPLYDTLGLPACTFIMNQTSLETIACDTMERAMKLVENALLTPSLKNIIVLHSEIEDEMRAKAKDEGVTLYSFEEIESIGVDNPQEKNICSSKDVYTMCYTSGTTGDPKGVIVTHRSLLSNVYGGYMQRQTKIGPEDAYLSFLPLAHILERFLHVYLFMNGSHIGFYSGNIKLILEDLASLKPALFITAPRLLNRIYDKVHQGVSGSFIKSTLFNLAKSRKRQLLQQGIVTDSTIWDMLVFNKVRNLLGGKVKLIMVGGAPVADEVLEFSRIAFGCPVMNGYGQTEVSGCLCLSLEHDVNSGDVGPPIPGCIVKLFDVPDMDYYAEDGKGEVCTKSPCCTPGYYKDAARTNELIDSDNWLHTGDIGYWQSNGALKIIDRKKDIFKLAQGEYIAPAKIENTYLNSPFVAQIYVDGNPLKNYPVAIVNPEPEYLLAWAVNNGLSGKNIEELCSEKKVVNAVLKSLDEIDKTSGLKGFEKVKSIILIAEQFSLENGLLTATFKLKRSAIRKRFIENLDQLYDI